MVVYITGHTRGIGKDVFDYFVKNGYTVIGLSRSNGFDLEKVQDISNMIIPGSIFVNNAYANGVQKDYIMHLHNKVSKMIVCGSIASKYPDPNMPKYSQDKQELEKIFFDHANRKTNTNYLLLGLTSTSYKDKEMIIKTLDFWLNNNNIIQIGFNIDE